MRYYDLRDTLTDFMLQIFQRDTTGNFNCLINTCARCPTFSYVARQTEVLLTNLQPRLRDMLTGNITDERKQTA